MTTGLENLLNALTELEYLGDSVSAGRDKNSICLVKEFSDGSYRAITLDSEVLSNFLEYIADRGQ